MSSSWHFSNILSTSCNSPVNIFCLKVKLLEIHVRQMIFDFWQVFNFLTFARMVLSSCIFVLTRFFSYCNLSSWTSPIQRDQALKMKQYELLFILLGKLLINFKAQNLNILKMKKSKLQFSLNFLFRFTLGIVNCQFLQF